MFKKWVPLNRESHAKLYTKPSKALILLEGFCMALLMAQEFARAAAFYPIVCLKHKETHEFWPLSFLAGAHGSPQRYAGSIVASGY